MAPPELCAGRLQPKAPLDCLKVTGPKWSIRMGSSANLQRWLTIRAARNEIQHICITKEEVGGFVNLEKEVHNLGMAKRPRLKWGWGDFFNSFD